REIVAREPAGRTTDRGVVPHDDAIENGNRRAIEGEALLVERHRVERPLPTEQEMAARRKTREGGILDERSYPTVREIDHAHVVSRVGLRDVQKSGPPTRPATGPPRTFLPSPLPPPPPP